MEIVIIIIFIVGYVLITLEHSVGINKTATALVTGVLCWTVYILNSEPHTVTDQLLEQLGEISGILFFLMGAMTIVELIDSHNAFDIINKAIATRNRRILLWIVCALTFFLSAVLDNLTTTIVMVTLCQKLIRNMNFRMIFIGMIIIAANSGGAWSPIGDVTTTMLWISGRISTTAIIASLFLPSLVSLIVPLTVATLMINGETEKNTEGFEQAATASSKEQKLILLVGLLVLVLVPVFKTVTHLPPFMGMLLGLGTLWIITEILHRKKNEDQKQQLSVVNALQRMDVPSILFFLGILLAVGALQYTGLLSGLANQLSTVIRNEKMLVGSIGIISAIVDNVPIVAASMAMYSMDIYTADHSFWLLLAFCAGTGGSLLIIGSAAGVAAMGLEKITFGWYFKKISWLALLGYISGIVTFIGLEGTK